MRRNGEKYVWFSDETIICCPNGNYAKKVAKLTNKILGTKSKFSGPFTEEELRRFNSISSTGKW